MSNDMKGIILEERSLLKIQFELIRYPKLDSPHKIIKKGIKLLERYTPRVANYLSKQKALAKISEYSVQIVSNRRRKEKRIKRYLKLWIKKEKFKRIILMILEGSILPLTPFLAVIPGPNVFFYVPFLLFYFHFKSYQGLSLFDPETVEIIISTN